MAQLSIQQLFEYHLQRSLQPWPHSPQSSMHVAHSCDADATAPTTKSHPSEALAVACSGICHLTVTRRSLELRPQMICAVRSLLRQSCGSEHEVVAVRSICPQESISAASLHGLVHWYLPAHSLSSACNTFWGIHGFGLIAVGALVLC